MGLAGNKKSGNVGASSQHIKGKPVEHEKKKKKGGKGDYIPQRDFEEYNRKKEGPTVRDQTCFECGVSPLRTTINGTVNTGLLPELALAIIGIINDKTGFIPQSNDAFTYGSLIVYLRMCFAWYCHLAGTWSGTVTDLHDCGGYHVPGFVGVMFHQTATMRHLRGTEMTPKYVDYTVAVVNAAIAENGGVAPVKVGNAANNEWLFGAGGAVSGPLTSSYLNAISGYMAEGFEGATVRIDGIARVAANLENFGEANDDYRTSAIPIPGTIIPMMLSSVQGRTGPHYATIEEVYVDDGTTTANNLWISTFAWLFRNIPYDPKLTLMGMIRHCNFDPYKIRLKFEKQAFSRFVALCVDYLAEKMLISTGTADASQSYMWNFIVYQWARLVSRSTFLSRTFGSSTTGAFYSVAVAKDYRTASVFNVVGTLPTRKNDTIIVPWWPCPTYALATFVQPSVPIAKNFTDDGAKMPMDWTPDALFKFAGAVPLAHSTLQNAVPIHLTEEIWNAMNVYNSHTVTVLTKHSGYREYCPCEVGYSESENTLSLCSATVTMFYSKVEFMSCLRTVGVRECKASLANTFNVRPMYGIYYELMRNASHNPHRDATSSCISNSPTDAANMGSGPGNNLTKKSENSFWSNLMSDAEVEMVNVAGNALHKAAKEYLGEYITVGPPPSIDSVRSGLQSGSFVDALVPQLGSMIATGAGGIVTKLLHDKVFKLRRYRDDGL